MYINSNFLDCSCMVFCVLVNEFVRVHHHQFSMIPETPHEKLIFLSCVLGTTPKQGWSRQTRVFSIIYHYNRDKKGEMYH